ncbi:MAG: SMI1/KNR4 family protein [Chloroflexi bacterium]|nr:SMI1/KNR4 family protein [Chloroflexota bacterium]OJV95959.1 MAG: hypothetical protein BGO39_03745 [Chloroflexi bacterium 54-19]
MTTDDWLNLLNWWSDEAQRLDDKFAWFYGHLFERVTFSLDASPELMAAIKALETRLGKALPPSYRDFLAVGGPKFNINNLYFWDLEKVDWFEKSDPKFFERWEQFFKNDEWLEELPEDYNSRDYGQLSSFTIDQKELLQNMLYVGGGVLLNPATTTSEGEWEAWLLNENEPFVTRYRSLYELMLIVHEDYAEKSRVLWLEPERILDPTTNKITLVYSWQPFLQKWNELVFKPGIREDFLFDPGTLEEYDRENPQLTRTPASEAEIEATEIRLAITFPPSYRQFLKVSNGLAVHHQKGMLAELFPLSEVKWGIDGGNDKDFWERELGSSLPLDDTVSDEEYYDYVKQNNVITKIGHALATLFIGDYDGNDFYLLNPLVVNKDGEWEAWSLMHDGGDLERYISFWHMLQEIYYRMFVM